MSRVIAIVPARAGSKGIPHKNFRLLAGKSPAARALECLDVAIGAETCGSYLSTDGPTCVDTVVDYFPLRRPAELAQDDTPMLAVVQHALEQIHGEPDDLILLVQPTQPLRQPKHLTQAIELLRETQADSVVSVVELPLTHSPEFVLRMHAGKLWQWCEDGSVRVVGDTAMSTSQRPTRRQEATQVYVRDGTVYAFWRKTLHSGTFYGRDCRPLIISPDETCPLDTPEDWAEAERRLRAREG